MTCRDVVGFLADYLEDHLDNATKMTFEHHLALCRSCTAYLASYRETIRLTKSLDLDDDELHEELVDVRK